MDGSIEAVTSGIEAMTDRYGVIAHNLANANTAGFKRQMGLLSQVAPVAGQVVGSDEISTSQISGRNFIDFTQGVPVKTGRALDCALDGKGFFVIETPEGPLYTRHGIFQVNARSQLVDSRGRTVSGNAGPIILPSDAGPGSVQISSDGWVSAGGQTVGQLQIVEFDKPGDLTPVGATCFRAPLDVSPVAATATTVQQGFHEASNVSVVEELVNLIMVSRLYQANMKIVQVQDDRMASLLQAVMG